MHERAQEVHERGTKGAPIWHLMEMVNFYFGTLWTRLGHEDIGAKDT